MTFVSILILFVSYLPIMKNVLVAVDYDDSAEILVNYARALTKPFDAKIWIVHIASPDDPIDSFEAGTTYLRDARANELREEHRALQRLAEKVRAHDQQSESLLIMGATVELLVREANKLNADLVICGSHDHNWLYNLLIGNTARALFKKLKIPLLTLPLDDKSIN